ncbi:MAG: metal-dependent hydrolase [Woeseiaceae bacterium]|nr:metal-dependent hydrolase [Gammaproteobacteria bacterium]NNK25555.1 metal-dependent hydrolase [Woeseiaceae bacterium]
MDSITQAALGACVTAVCVPREHRRRALLAGAMLGTLPDLDIFIDFGDAVRNFTYHRGFSHSLFVLPGVAVVIWLALRRWWAPVRAAPRPWFAGIFLALVTHPLIDAHTAYGTQLLWPLAVTPTSWATMFIIDPLFTLPLIVGVIALSGWALRPSASKVVVAGLALSSAYLGWTWVAKTLAEQQAHSALADAGVEYRAMFSTPTPLNSVLWRVVVLTDDGYAEGFDSLLIDEGRMAFRTYASDTRALAEASDLWAVQRLRWFAADFIRADVEDGRLVITDLRMGQEPSYVFRHVVAERGNPHWKPLEPERLMLLFDRGDLGAVWQRILHAE